MGQVFSRKVNRKSIIEVGNLASTSAGDCRKLFPLLVHYLDKQKVEWCVCTGTSAVRASLKRSGIEHMLIKRAHGEAMGDKESSWGTYYRNNPFVLTVHIPTALESLGDTYALTVE